MLPRKNPQKTQMLSKMKTKQVQSTQLVAICVEKGEGLVCLCMCSHITHVVCFSIQRISLGEYTRDW